MDIATRCLGSYGPRQPLNQSASGKDVTVLLPLFFAPLLSEGHIDVQYTIGTGNATFYFQNVSTGVASSYPESGENFSGNSAEWIHEQPCGTPTSDSTPPPHCPGGNPYVGFNTVPFTSAGASGQHSDGSWATANFAIFVVTRAIITDWSGNWYAYPTTPSPDGSSFKVCYRATSC